MTTFLRTIATILFLAALCQAADNSLPLASEVDRVYPASETLYLDLHRNPELSFQETQTAKKMAAHLTALGYEVTSGVGGTGVVGVMKNGTGPVILLRTELDALPIHEETGLPYASTITTKNDAGSPVPVMHACGHDLHMASLVGAADIMAHNRQLWHGTLVLIGQPAEEQVQGAEAMLKDGLFTRFPKPEIALAVHDTDALPSGTIGYTSGFALTSGDSLNITIYGRGGHGSRPHVTIDPIVIASKIVLNLQTIVAREVKPGELAVITVGSFHAGSRNNIIPDTARLQLTVRAYKPEVRDHLLAAIQRVVKGEAMSSGAVKEPLIEHPESAPATYNDPDVTKRLAGVLAKSLGSENVKELEPDFPSEDFSRLQEAGAKIVMLRIGATKPDVFAAAQKSGEILPGLHTSRFAPDLKPALRTAIQTEVISLLELMGTK